MPSSSTSLLGSKGHESFSAHKLSLQSDYGHCVFRRILLARILTLFLAFSHPTIMLTLHLSTHPSINKPSPTCRRHCHRRGRIHHCWHRRCRRLRRSLRPMDSWMTRQNTVIHNNWSRESILSGQPSWGKIASSSNVSVCIYEMTIKCNKDGRKACPEQLGDLATCFLVIKQFYHTSSNNCITHTSTDTFWRRHLSTSPQIPSPSTSLLASFGHESLQFAKPSWNVFAEW